MRKTRRMLHINGLPRNACTMLVAAKDDCNDGEEVNILGKKEEGVKLEG